MSTNTNTLKLNTTATKVKTVAAVVARLVLGLIYFVFGLNFFLQFLPTPPPAGGAAQTFSMGLFSAGYFFPFMKGIEVLLGAFLLAGVFVPLSLVVLMPITLNILLFHAFLTDNAVMAVVMIVLQLFLAWSYRDYYKQLFTAKASLSL